MPRDVVVVCGNSKHGKDAFTDFLAEEAARCTRRAYADPLKEVLSQLLGVPLEYFYRQDYKATYSVYGKTLRVWLQQFGTEYCRNQIHRDIWIHRMADFVRSVSSDVVFISDGRFRNEIVTLRESLGEAAVVRSVKVVRPSQPVDLSHRSESEIYYMPDEEFDAVVVNDGSLKDLQEKAGVLLAQFEIEKR